VQLAAIRKEINMNLPFVTLISILGIAIPGTAQQIQSPAEFLRLLMADSSRVPAYGEGLQVMDQIAAMPPADVGTTIPVVFEAIHSQSLMAQLQGALALSAVSMRPDGTTLLEGRADEVLGLLQHNENRLKMTGVIVAARLNMPTSKLEAAFLRFLGDETQPMLVKPGVVSALVQMGPLSADSARLIGELLKNRSTEPPVRNATLNAIASRPTDSLVHADLIIVGLHDPDQNVRNNALYLLDRLGPNAIKRATPVLLQMSQDPNEAPAVRAMAGKLLVPNH
jgi:hypothetical protein